MSTPIRSIRNLGPAMETAFARAGIASAEALRAAGADAAYLAALRAGMSAHFAAYLSLVMGLQGRPWTDAQGPEKAALRARYEALRAALYAPGAEGETEGGALPLPPDLRRFIRDIGLDR